MNLAAKYRPKDWSDITEQSTVVEILKNICSKNPLDLRAFLFIGSQGIGKTTSCKIMANVLNEGQGDPIEIDAASHGGVEDIREIIRQARQFPVGCKYKVFIVDEVHAISPAGWSAFLACLESVPAKTVFLMATTNPEKIPATIISRLQVFRLSKISLSGITARLKHILDSEIAEGRNITYSMDAVSYIAKLGNGGMRDAITLLDKALAYSNNIVPETLDKALDLPNYDDYFALLQGYAKRDNTAISKIIDQVYNSGTNFIRWFEGFHSFIINITKYIFMQDIQATMIPPQYADKVSKYGPSHSVVCLKLANKLLKMNAELKGSQYLQEIALTYMCQLPKKE